MQRKTKTRYNNRGYKPKYTNKSLYKTAKMGYFRPQFQTPTMFPKTTVVKLNYTSTQDVGGVAHPNMSVLNISANNIYNPTSTSTNQPLGYDEWAVFYERYQVIGSKITVKIFGSASTVQNGMNGYLVRLRNSTGALTGDIDVQMQQPLTKYKVGRDGGAPLSMDQGAAAVSLTNNFSCKKWFNLKDVSDNIATGANFGSNPEVEAYYSIIVAPLVTGDTSQTMTVHVHVEYVVMFSIPRTVAGSSL